MRKPEEIASRFGKRFQLDVARNLYFVGIGGAGMSALAELALLSKYDPPFHISGCDSIYSETLDRLNHLGARIGGHDSDIAGQLKGIEAVIATDAIDLDTDPVILEAKSQGIPIYRRSQLLGSLLKDRRLVAVTGTHGKTTTTGLVAEAFLGAGLYPTVVEGAFIPEWQSSIQIGSGAWAIAEACEAYNGMLDLDPEVVILTNLELDHQDFHKSFENLERSMIEFVSKVGKSGLLIYNAEDAGATQVALKAEKEFGITTQGYRSEDGVFGLALLGKHNKMNAAAAVTALVYAVSKSDHRSENGSDSIRDGIERMKKFHGADRRLQLIRQGDITVFDDYAHTPTEIEASISALRDAYPFKRLVVVFQPHLYSRTQGNEVKFSRALNLADMVFLTDIYPAREDPIPGVSSAVISEHLSVTNRYVPSRFLLPREVAKHIKSGDIVVGMGAGNIGQFPQGFIQEIERFGYGSNRIDQLGGKRKLKVAVVCGGDSSEREVSLHSGKAIFEALQMKGHEPYLIDISDKLLSDGDLQSLTKYPRPDAAFLAVHGVRAEDGALQGLLELLHIPYTGSGVQCCSIAMDKNRTKELLKFQGILVPKGSLLKRNETWSVSSILAEFPLPIIVKPNSEGSTMGVTFVNNEVQLKVGIIKAFSFGDELIIEELVQGIEISTPVLCGKPLLPVEIEPNSGVYDFASKYTIGATREIVPARLPNDLLEKCREVALKCHQILKCEGASRTDMILRNEDVIVLEVNTLPGMTKTSLLPTSALASGIEFPDLCEQLLFDAMQRYAAKA